MPRAARRQHGRDSGTQAAQRRRRLLAWRRKAAHAATHLWHRLRVRGRAVRPPRQAGGSGAPRPPHPGPSVGPLHHPRRNRPRPGRLAPQGRPRPLTHRGLLERHPLPPRLRRGLLAPYRALDAVADQRAPGLLPRGDVLGGGGGRAGILSEADELSLPHHHLPLGPAQLP